MRISTMVKNENKNQNQTNSGAQEFDNYTEKMQ